MGYHISFDSPHRADFKSAVGILIARVAKMVIFLGATFWPKNDIFEKFRRQKKLKPLYKEQIGISFIPLGPKLSEKNSHAQVFLNRQ